MIPRIRTIVVGVDTVRNTGPILESAIELADFLGATLHVVHGYMLTDPLLDAYARAGYLGQNTLVDFGRELQSSLEAEVSSLKRSSAVVARAVAGSPVSALMEVAAEVSADLVIVGSTRHGTFPLSLLGSTCRAVLRRAAVPVFVVRPDRPVVPRKILAPTDLSALSAAALPWAIALSGSAPAPEVRSMLVINEALMLLPLEQKILAQVAEEQLGEFIGGSALGEAISERIVRTGDPASQIVAEAAAWGADLVVLATNARKGMERFLIGSVAESTLKSAPCHVLVVPPGADRRPDGSVGATGSAVLPDTEARSTP